MDIMVITVDETGVKTVESTNYNSKFDLLTGYTERWGTSVEDDDTPPVLEVVDIEVTTKCNGVNGVPCPVCYKGNTSVGESMSFEEFKVIFDKLPKTLNQMAFSADSSLKTNPAVFEMMRYCRDNPNNPVAPSISVAQLARDEAVKLVEAKAGCVGVSLYEDKDVCYDTVKLLIDTAKEVDYPLQVNIQAVVCEASFDKLMGVLDDLSLDPRLEGLHSIVYLALKQKNRGKAFDRLSDEKWGQLLRKTSEVSPFYGVDVCTTKKLAASGVCGDHKDMLEPCDAGYYSCYISVNGGMYPCSFLEGVGDWPVSETLLNKSFDEIWNSEQFKDHRCKLQEVRCMDCKKSCIYWEI